MQQEHSDDRRMFRRFDMGLPVKAEIDGITHDGKLFDLSLGGASIAPADKSWLTKLITVHGGELGDDLRLDAKIVSVSDDRCHLIFDLNERSEEELTFFMMTTDLTR